MTREGGRFYIYIYACARAMSWSIWSEKSSTGRVVSASFRGKMQSPRISWIDKVVRGRVREGRIGSSKARGMSGGYRMVGWCSRWWLFAERKRLRMRCHSSSKSLTFSTTFSFLSPVCRLSDKRLSPRLPSPLPTPLSRQPLSATFVRARAG